MRRGPEPFEALAWAITERPRFVARRRDPAADRAPLGVALPAHRASRRAGRADAAAAPGPRGATRAATSAAGAPWRCGVPPPRSRRAAWTCGRPTTSVAGRACGRSRAWAVDARCARAPRAGPLDRCRRATLLPQARGRLRGGDPCARATEEEVRELFAPYGRGPGSRACARPPRAAARSAPSGRARLRAPLRAGTRSSPRRRRRPREQVVVAHPARVGLPLLQVLPAERLARARGEEGRQRRLDAGPCKPRSRSGRRDEQASTRPPGRRAGAASARERLHEAAQLRAAVLVAAASGARRATSSS